jgi:uncharacterized membrane protein
VSTRACVHTGNALLEPLDAALRCAKLEQRRYLHIYIVPRFRHWVVIFLIIIKVCGAEIATRDKEQE